MTTALLVCILVTIAVLVYVFYLPGELHLGPKKTRLTYLRERKDVIYENLRDLNFENNAGKFSEADYLSLKSSLEDEAAAVLSEIARMEEAVPAADARERKGAGI